MVAAVAVHSNQTDMSHTDELCQVIRSSPYQFLQPTSALQQAALNAAKAILDPLAAEVIAAQTARRNENRRKRKRGSDEVADPVLQLRQIYTKGLSVKQVWEQAKRVLDAASNEVERGIQQEAIEDQHDDPDQDSDEEEARLNQELDDLDTAEPDEAILNEHDFDEEDLQDEEIQDAENIEDDSDIMLSSNESEDDESKEQEVYVQDPNNLNDGFFSIDDFNKQSQFLEQMDVRGEDEDPSDEDDVDFTVDPLTQPFSKPKPGAQKDDVEDEMDDDLVDGQHDEEGPTFANANLSSEDEDEAEEIDDIDGEALDGGLIGLANTNDIHYADFFEPPPRKPSKNKRMRALPKTQPTTQNKESRPNDEDNLEEDMERAMADVRRDLLESDEDVSEDEEEDDDDGELSSEDGAKVVKKSRKDKNLSTHEKQKANIAQEIRRLEAANVARKDWTVSGEASAGSRPLNSLLDEGGDLDFERVGKPVPVITAEVSDDIEALIKRRILAREFDEVIRRHPTAIGEAADTRRGRAEIDDSKPSAGLGEIYEQEHLRQSDPTAYVDKRSAATKQQHEEIDRLWQQVREQLDVLGNLHFKPKRLDVEIKAVEDKPRLAMEDARPTADIDSGDMLAPQEVYKPGTDGRSASGEILVGQTGASRNKEEMSREEKIRRRRRDKERQKKAKGNQTLVVLGEKEKVRRERQKEKQGVMDDLQRGGVKVIGKGGETQELSKKASKNRTSNSGHEDRSSSSFKL